MAAAGYIPGLLPRAAFTAVRHGVALAAALAGLEVTTCVLAEETAAHGAPLTLVAQAPTARYRGRCRGSG